MAIYGTLLGIGVKECISAITNGTTIPGVNDIVGYFAGKINNSKDLKKYLDTRELKKIVKSKTKEFTNSDSVNFYILRELFDFLAQTEIQISEYSSVDNLSRALRDTYRKKHSNDSEDEISLACVILAAWADTLFSMKADDMKGVLKSMAKEFQNLETSVSENEKNIQAVKSINESKWLKQDNINDVTEGRLSALETDKTEKNFSANDKYKEYKHKWVDNVFLNDFDEMDENRGVNVELSQIYQEPPYIWKTNADSSGDILSLLRKQLKKPLLILGQPGIGKSTLISYILNAAPDELFYKKILVFKWADLHLEACKQEESCGEYILRTIGKEKRDLSGALLIFDGLDEMSTTQNRGKLVNELAEEWKMEDFTFVVTCRENYIQAPSNWTNLNYITLLPWNENQIEQFINAYSKAASCKVDNNTINIASENSDVLGIPLILYIALAMNIRLNDIQSIVDIYDEIFKINGGIYDRLRYDNQHKEISVQKIKTQVHQMSRDLAMWMYKNNPDSAEAPKEAYMSLPSFDSDLIYGSYFKAVPHHEGDDAESICFVHRTIYEFFVAEQFCTEIINCGMFSDVDSPSVFYGATHIELVKKIVSFLASGELTTTIQTFIERLLSKRLGQTKDSQTIVERAEDIIEYSFQNGFLSYLDSLPTAYREVDVQCCRNAMLFLASISRAFEYQLYSDFSKYFHFVSLYENKLLDLSGLKVKFEALKNCFLQRYIFAYSDLIVHANRCSFLCSFEETMFIDSDIEDSSLAESEFINCSFINTTFKNVRIPQNIFKNAVLEDVMLNNMYLNKTSLKNAVFDNVSIKYSNLNGSHFESMERLSFGEVYKSSINEAHFSSAQIPKLGKAFFETVSYKRIYIDGKEYVQQQIMDEFFR